MKMCETTDVSINVIIFNLVEWGCNEDEVLMGLMLLVPWIWKLECYVFIFQSPTITIRSLSSLFIGYRFHGYEFMVTSKGLFWCWFCKLCDVAWPLLVTVGWLLDTLITLLYALCFILSTPNEVKYIVIYYCEDQWGWLCFTVLTHYVTLMVAAHLEHGLNFQSYLDFAKVA